MRVRARGHEFHIVEQPLAPDAFEPREFGERIGVIVDAQADRRILLGGPDRDRRRLLAALVAAFWLARHHRGDQPAHERFFARCLERVRGRRNHVGARQHVAGNRDARPHDVPAPVDAVRAGMHRDAALRVMHVKLALFGAAVGRRQMFDHGLRRHPFAQQAHAAIAPERVRQRLRGERADAALAMGADRADREELARNRDAIGAARVARDDGPGHGSPLYTRADAMQPTFTTRPDIRGTFGAVATTHWLATQTGMAVLERGGNAFDAAVAAGFVLQIVEPHLNGPGGELPAIVLRAGAERAGCDLRPRAISGRRIGRAAPRHGSRADARHRAAAGRRAGRIRRLDAAVARLRHAEARDVLSYAIFYAEHGFPLVPRIVATIIPAVDYFPDRMAELRRSMARQRQAAASRQAVPHARHRRRRTSAFSPRRKPPAATACARSRPRGTPTTKASSPRRSTASTRRELIDSTGERHRGLLTGDDLARYQARVETPVSRSIITA